MIQEIESTALSHYRLQQLLARGGMSVVYRAYDTRRSRTVAIKLVHRSERDYYIRFQREAQALASLSHDHILPAFEYGEYGSWFYMVMPFIEYGSLKQRLTEGPLSTGEVGRILTQLADALQFAHERGIVHRDIKPANILLRDGEHVYLADFGLVRHVQEMSELAHTGTLLGTPEYMAPELSEGLATPSSDIYALGIVLYQMLTGRLPFRSSTPVGLYWKHLREQPIAPSIYNSTLSRATDAVVLRALAKEPEQRFQSASQLAQAYQASLLIQRKTPTRTHIGTSVVAATLLLGIVPSLLGFSSYIIGHAQAPTRSHAREALVNSHTGTPPVTPHHILTPTKTPPLAHMPTKVLMSQLVVHHVTSSSSKGSGNNSKRKHKHKYSHENSADEVINSIQV
ncbi:MAG: hypothetical protein NVS4B12_12720 [Ktedonobacteraceae bacterium]